MNLPITAHALVAIAKAHPALHPAHGFYFNTVRPDDPDARCLVCAIGLACAEELRAQAIRIQAAHAAHLSVQDEESARAICARQYGLTFDQASALDEGWEMGSSLVTALAKQYAHIYWPDDPLAQELFMQGRKAAFALIKGEQEPRER